MSPVTSFHAQLASIMEVLANAAVAEICALVDCGCAALRLEVSRSRKENEALRRRLRLAELRAARAAARPRAHEPGRLGTATPTAAASGLSREEVRGDLRPPASGQETRPLMPTGEITVVVKVEDEEPWEQPESRGFCRVSDGHTETNVTLPPVEDGGVSSKSWMSGEVSSTCSSALHAAQRPPPSGYEPVSGTVQVPPAGLRDRQQRASEPPTQEAGRREEPGGRPYVCTFCGKSLACLKNLKTHVRVHTGEKPFVCTLCGKRFSDSSNLKRHQSVHTGEKRYGCVHCGKRFAQSGSLKVHMSVHTDCKQFRCAHCSKTFISGAHLRRHVAVHAADTRPAAPPPR